MQFSSSIIALVALCSAANAHQFYPRGVNGTSVVATGTGASASASASSTAVVVTNGAAPMAVSGFAGVAAVGVVALFL